MIKFLKYLIITLIVWFCLHIGIIVIDGLKDELHIVDVGIVLGNKVEITGEPSKRLQSRLDRAVVLYKEGYFKYVIVSGGIGKEGFDEAEVMKNYLVQAGVPEENIILDNKGNNTFMTAKNSKLIIDEMEFKSVMVISQYYHITRTRLAFEKAGLEKVYTAHARLFEVRDIYSLTREFVAFYKYLII